ncbi:MAG: hypothetical protein H0W01_04145 [Pseudonocardiales bacterium]|nr:hypothetical protein [Pseudonocardiales bacterium]
MASAELARCLGQASASRDAWLRNRGRPRLCQQVDQHAWSDLFGLEMLDELLHGTALRRPYFHVTKAGKRSPLSVITRDVRVLNATLTGVPHAEHVYQELGGGASLVLLQLEHLLPALRKFCGGISAELDRAVDCGAYVTPPESTGLPLHVDAQDVILLQVAGVKSWAVHERVGDERPVGRGLRSGERPARLVEAQLRPGDALVIPNGHAHSAVAGNNVSCHLTIGITAPTRREGLSSLVERKARRIVGLDRALQDGEDGADAVRVDVERLIDLLREGDDSGLFPRTHSPLLADARLRNLYQLLSDQNNAKCLAAPGAKLGTLPGSMPELADALALSRPFRLREMVRHELPPEWVIVLANLVLRGELAVSGEPV